MEFNEDDEITSTPKHRKRLVQFTGEIAVGHILQAAVIATGIIAWGVTRSDILDQQKSEMHQFKDDVTSQLADLHKDMQEQIRAMPVVQSQLANIQQQFGSTSQHLQAIDQNLGLLNEKTAALRIEVDGLERASEGPTHRGR